MFTQSLVRAALFGSCIGLLGLLAVATPPLANLEVDIGLKWLFHLRDPRPAPDRVVVVTIDKTSSQRFGLRNRPRDWPRSHHADLVQRLSRQGAAVIAFDVIFEQTRDADQDRRFAEAVAGAGNVILFQYLKRDRVALAQPEGGNDSSIDIEILVPPIPELADAALGLAPFPLPKVPIRINQTWLFKRSAGDAATLPVVALTALAMPHFERLREVLNDIEPRWIEDLPDTSATQNRRNRAGRLALDLRDFLLSHPEAASQLEARLAPTGRTRDRQAPHQLLAKLVHTLSGPESRFLDFYGPPHSISTLSYADVLLGDASDDPLPFAGKVVFVGFSEQFQPEQRDGFYTVFSRPDGLDVSGVEIAATAFANLIEGREVTPLPHPWRWLSLFLWGLLLGGLLLVLPTLAVVPAAVLGSLAYLAGAQLAFANDGTWFPLFIPLLIQSPIALLGALLWRYLAARRAQRKMRHAFGHYVPPELVDELAQGNLELAHKGELVFGVCLATDAEQYTGLSERLQPQELHGLLNRYYRILFAAVRRHGGIVSDVVGDAMLAIWATEDSTLNAPERACRTAWDILRGVAAFNSEQGHLALPTRIGIHCGPMMLGNVGADDHFEYRAVGDSVNTANRIQGLNKTLSTRILISEEVAQGLPQMHTRPLGRFRLSGKIESLSIHELLCIDDPSQDRTGAEDAQLQTGLEAFGHLKWSEAADFFRHRLELCSEDGPALFYLRLSREYAKNPPPPTWDGVLQIEKK